MSGSVLPDHLRVALKEWAAVCRALESGRQMILLRKGGIYESAGEFEVEHPAFLLLPTYLHQKLEMIKPNERAGFEARNEEPAEIVFSAAAVVSDIIELHSRAQMEQIEDEHIWLPSLIDMRFNYRPENPLYLLLVRAYRMKQPIKMPNTPAYLGCKSWVKLDGAISTAGTEAVMNEKEFERRRETLLHGLT